MLDRKYNRRVMAKLLIYDPEPLSMFGEDGNTTPEVKMSKFKEIIYNIIEAIISFFKQVWRAMTSTIKRLKTLRKELDSLDKVKFNATNDAMKPLATTGGHHFATPRLSYTNNSSLFKANMKLIREITDGCNAILNQRLKDLSSGNKVGLIKDNKAIEVLNKKRAILDKIVADYEQHDKFYMIKFNYEDRGIKIGKNIVPEDGLDSNTVTSDVTFRNLISNMKRGIDNLVSYASKTEEELDRATSNRRKLMMALDKTNTDGKRSEVVKELKDVLNINLNSSRKGFGLMMKMSGGVIKEYGTFVKWCKKNYEINE